ncbi:unnamed protein product, partial [Mesorhabditis belari]|uniref:Prostaglandin E synthase 2 n=1 Tax=Mesorhabditis belari TaxID=2138241 RepID=A0AAF3EBJ7_9BILA
MAWTQRLIRPVSIAGIFGFGAVSTSTLKNDEVPYKISVERPAIKRPLVQKEILSRRIINEDDHTGLKLRLYQYQSCPFCCKIRALLDYYGFSYDIVEVNPVSKKELSGTNGYKKVPVLRLHDSTYLMESSLIMSQLATFLQNEKRSIEEIIDMYPAIDSFDENGKAIKKHPNKYFTMLEKNLSPAELAKQREEREWREWVDEHFIHLISPNVYRSMEESLETFKSFEVAGEWERIFSHIERIFAVALGATVMYFIGKRLKKKHNIVDERQSLHDACEKWMDALGSRKFMGGDQPNLADLALYGAMNSFVGCRAFKEVIAKERISTWYMRVKESVENSEGRQAVKNRVATK